MTSAEQYHSHNIKIDDAFKALAGDREGIFWRDGILDPSQYVKARHKILWILKEPYAQKGKNEAETKEFRLETDNFRDDFMRKGIEGYNKWRRTYGPIVRISYALLYEQREYYAIDIKNVWREVMPQIAIINAKKTPGGSTSWHKEISEHFEKYKDLLTKQILGIEPDIIFECAYGAKAVRDAVRMEGGSIKHNAIVKHLNHPACRKRKTTYFEHALEGVVL